MSQGTETEKHFARFFSHLLVRFFASGSAIAWEIDWNVFVKHNEDGLVTRKGLFEWR